ncbi:MAG: signal recognition particle-docking protein FtsY [Tidjanibacter sp.]|nr:signal recognition particle-docking protein FtsY [Tidjanibacter sp.]
MALFDIFRRRKAEPVAPTPAPEVEATTHSAPEVEATTHSAPELPAEEPAEVVPARQEEIDEGLKKTKEGFFGKLARAVAGRSQVDESFLDDLEEVLITSDVGVETTVKIIRNIEARVARDKYMNTAELNAILRDEISLLLKECEEKSDNFGLSITEGTPYVVMVVGVNGAGKTTTIGKLAAQLTKAGLKVFIGAADTFRAAAIDQLQVWADRAGATMIRQDMGSDPASVAFDTLKSAVANKADVVLIDTAGRLHNKVGLMNELSKIRNVMAKIIPDAPHEVMLVLDGSTGQNAFEQARQFTAATKVNSLAITKLDGTAKGGVVIGISDQFGIPVHYIGIGEGIDQLKIFDRKQYVNALFGDK